MTLSFTLVAKAGYGSNGHFPSNNLKICRDASIKLKMKDGTSYASLWESAIKTWNTNTDLNLTEGCWGAEITVRTHDTGTVGKLGVAVICTEKEGWGDYCGSIDNPVFPHPDNDYVSCDAYLNRTAFHTDTDYGYAVHTALHELGHCWSLAHRTSTTSVMRLGKHSQWTLNSDDKKLVNDRY